MDDNTSQAHRPELTGFWQKHRFFLLVSAAIVAALTLVTISLVIYNLSGSAQLDLSRPGYQAVSDQVSRDDSIDEYSASGDVTLSTIDEFLTLYDEQATKAKAVDAFNGDPLNPELLEFSSAATE